jgi:hypothetical protein
MRDIQQARRPDPPGAGDPISLENLETLDLSPRQVAELLDQLRGLTSDDEPGSPGRGPRPPGELTCHEELFRITGTGLDFGPRV